MMPNDRKKSGWQAGWDASDPVLMSTKYEMSEYTLNVALAS